MGKQYPIKLLGEIKQVLGTEVIWGPDWAVLRMTRNIIHVAKEYRVLELADKTSKVPLTKADIDSLEMPTEISGIAPYRYLLGELAWISSTQQDFIFHIRMMASYAGTDNLADMATKPLEHIKQAEYAALILAKPS